MRNLHFRQMLIALYNHCCAWCGGDWGLEVDHVVTTYEGGGNSSENFQILCRRCNAIKNYSSMPKLPPRQPQPDEKKMARRQDILKHKIMPRNRGGDGLRKMEALWTMGGIC